MQVHFDKFLSNTIVLSEPVRGHCDYVGVYFSGLFNFNNQISYFSKETLKISAQQHLAVSVLQ